MKITINVDYDLSPQDVKEMLECKFGMYHRRYNFPNDFDVVPSDFNNWTEMREELEQHYKVVAPLYMYEHSGISISLAPFSCPWDSGQIGFVAYDGEEEDTEVINKQMSAEVELYDKYLKGEIYEYVISKDDGTEVLDYCGGFVSEEEALQVALETATELLVAKQRVV